MTMEVMAVESPVDSDEGAHELPKAEGSTSTDHLKEKRDTIASPMSDIPPPLTAVSPEGISVNEDDVSLPSMVTETRQAQGFSYSEIPDSEEISDTTSAEAISVQGDGSETNPAAIEEDGPDGQALRMEGSSIVTEAASVTQPAETLENAAETTSSLLVDSNETDISSSTATINQTSGLKVATDVTSTVEAASASIKDIMMEVPASDASDEEFSETTSPMKQTTTSTMLQFTIADAAFPDEAENTPLPTSPSDSSLPEVIWTPVSDINPGLKPSLKENGPRIDEPVQEENNSMPETSTDGELPSTISGASVNLDTVKLDASAPTIEQHLSSPRDSSTESNSQDIQEIPVTTDSPDLPPSTVSQISVTSPAPQNALINPTSSTSPPTALKATFSRKFTSRASFSAPEGSQNKDIIMAELKAMKMVSPNSQCRGHLGD